VSIRGAGAAAELLRAAETVLLIDWPNRDVPEALARAGLEVLANEGPQRGYNRHVADGVEVRTVPVSHAPTHADLVYAFRPIDELADIVERALALGAKAVWYQSGLDRTGAQDPRACWLPPDELSEARRVVESAGLAFVSEPYIADVAREAQPG
jgi:hypothetical protein